MRLTEVKTLSLMHVVKMDVFDFSLPGLCSPATRPKLFSWKSQREAGSQIVGRVGRRKHFLIQNSTEESKTLFLHFVYLAAGRPSYQALLPCSCRSWRPLVVCFSLQMNDSADSKVSPGCFALYSAVFHMLVSFC